MIFVSLVVTSPAVVEAPPLWLKQGIYAKYAAQHPGGLNGITLKTKLFSYDYYQWDCINQEGHIAVLNITVFGNQAILYSQVVHVNTQDRGVTFPNGTYIGKTWLWLPADPSSNDAIEVTDNRWGKPRTWNAIVTPQGGQKGYTIEPEGGLAGGSYDLNTGLAIQPCLTEEPTLLAMGVRQMGTPTLSDTNVDLGPRELWVDILASLPVVLPVVGFAGVVLFVWYRRKKKREREEAVMERKRKHAISLIDR